MKVGNAARFAALIAVALSGTAHAAELDAAIIKAARAEGTVVALVGIGNSEVGPRLIEDFEKRYGIRVEFEYGRGAGNEEKIKTQRRAGRMRSDVLITGEGSYFSMLDELELYQVPNAANTAPIVKSLNLPSTPVYTNLYGFLVSTTRLKPADYPRKWDDLANPRFKGELIMDDPTRAGALNAFIVLRKAKGTAFWESVAKLNPRIAPQYPENENAVARGEYAVYIPAQISSVFRVGKGADVKFIRPEDGYVIGTTLMGQVKGAPHPNASRVLMNYLLSVEAQAIYASGGLVPVVTGVKVPLPEMAIEDATVVERRTNEEAADQKAASRAAAKIFNILR